MLPPPPTSTPFPTRRSSDLGPFRKTIPLAAIADIDPESGLLRPAWGFALSTDRAKPQAGRSSPRSEEHTSELQSRGHLVCRLLLEKKKKNNEYNKIQLEQEP